MRINIDSAGGAGLIKDLKPWQLPPNAFTTSNNIRFFDGNAETFAGYSDYITPSVVPYFVTSITSTTANFWVYCGLEHIYTGATQITRDAGGTIYTGTSADRWNSTTINGYLILNNNVDIPQSWSPSTSNDCVNLTGWDSNDTALILRNYKDFLFALDITKTATRYPSMVKWSDAADSNALPASWDITSTTGEAGENTLSETEGFLLDAVKLRDSLMIYKEDSVFGCQYIGGSFVFRFYRISGLIGALAQQCVVDLGNRHFVLGDGDCYVHDGQSSTSIIDKRNRDILFNLIDADNYGNCFVRHHEKRNEVWVCYPASGQTFPNKAFVWNYVDDTWTQRDLDANTVSMDYGIIADASYTWDTLPYPTWNDWTGTWGSRQYSPLNDALVSVTTDTEMFKHEDGNQDNGVSITCTLEKTNLELGQGSHMVKAIHPFAEGQAFNVYVGSQMTKNEAVSWEGPYAFDPSTGRRVTCRVTGRYHSVRFTSTDNVAWSLSGYGIEYESAGLR